MGAVTRVIARLNNTEEHLRRGCHEHVSFNQALPSSSSVCSTSLLYEAGNQPSFPSAMHCKCVGALTVW